MHGRDQKSCAAARDNHARLVQSICTTHTRAKSNHLAWNHQEVSERRELDALRPFLIFFLFVVIELGKFSDRSSFLYTHELARAGGTLSGQSFFFLPSILSIPQRVASCVFSRAHADRRIRARIELNVPLLLLNFQPFSLSLQLTI
jgi:hypothetical protein